MTFKRSGVRHLVGVALALATVAQGSVFLPDYFVTGAAAASRPAVAQTKKGDAVVRPNNHTPEPRGRIAFASDRDDNFEIYTMNPDGGAQTRLTNNPAEDVEPTWSPDGTRIAFVSSRDGNQEIYTMSADGSGDPTRLTNNPGADIDPVWSPDGRRIAFTSGRGNTDEIYLMNADGSAQTNLTNDAAGDDVQPSWSPGGAMLAFASTRGGDKFQIYRINLDGSNLVRLTNNTADDTHPAWPRGRIIFQSNRDDNDELYVVNAGDGGALIRATNNPAFDVEPAQSIDGARLVFASNRDGNFEIYAANADGSSPVRLTNNAEANDIQPAVESLTAGQPPNTVQFSAATYSVNESGGSVTVTVTRTGDTTAAAAVDYSAMSGTASERSDFITATGVLRFIPNEIAKSFSVLIVDDAFVEADETINLTLGSATGASLGALNTATLTIVDNDATAATGNPIDTPAFFVRQHYLDFLNREPEAEGLAAWLRVLNNCRAGDTSCDRVTVSSSFFLSQEFQSKGSFAIRFYLAALGRLPTYREFTGDLSRLNGATSNEVNANRLAFPNEFVERETFGLTFDALSNAAYVDRLAQTAGVAITNRDQQVADLDAGRKTRAQVLRELVESASFSQRVFNNVFIASEYFGYLRRDPDAAGFQTWLNYLNTHPGDYRTMVNGFVNSIEYRARFGRP